MKLLGAFLLSSLLLIGCSADPEISNSIEGGWTVKVTKLNVKLNEGELAVKNVSPALAVESRYLDQKAFEEALLLLLNSSRWEFYSLSSFKITYPAVKPNGNQPSMYAGTFQMKNGDLEKYYSGNLTDKATVRKVSISGNKIYLKIKTTNDFISAFGYELPLIVYQTAEDMLVSIELELQAVRE